MVNNLEDVQTMPTMETILERINTLGSPHKRLDSIEADVAELKADVRELKVDVKLLKSATVELRRSQQSSCNRRMKTELGKSGAKLKRLLFPH